jgi:FAD/FMN-containing dehydrogenase
MSAALDTDATVRAAYAADASGLARLPDAVARPESTGEVVDVLRRARVDRVPVTPAGMQTSTTGASIAERGILLSMRGMARIRDLDASRRTMRVEPGAVVADVKRAAAGHGLLFAPDPTSENECSIGGAIACNASGARTLRYGPTRPYVRALTVALASGEVIEVRRPGLDKNTAGYAVAQDPVDWFVGSEGTLGVILEAELALLPLPERVVALELPFRRESDALAFIVVARESRTVAPRCMEYFDEQATAIARGADESRAATGGTVVYVEQEVTDATMDAALDAWLALAEPAGASADDARVFDTEQGIALARRMRHAVPATMIERGAARRAYGGRRVSTDWAVPYPRLVEAVARSRTLADERGIAQPLTYGHAGNGHPHQNFIAHDADELVRIERVVEETLRAVVAMGGTVSAEHGIGKIKRRWLPLQLAPAQLGVMRAVKRELDPDGLFAPGNVFPDGA